MARATKGVKPGELSSAQVAAAKAAKTTYAAKTRTKKGRKRIHFVDVFFVYADGSKTAIRCNDIIARFAGLTLVTSENKFYTDENGTVRSLLTSSGKICKMSFGKTKGGRAKATGNTRSQGSVQEHYHSFHVPKDAREVDVLSWVNSWTRKPHKVKIGKNATLIGSSAAALKNTESTTPDPLYDARVGA
jgi:hypothetical protein